MGIDVHSLNFLRYVSKNRKLGRVATIGRQSLLLSSGKIARYLGIPPKNTDFGMYCEKLLKEHFGATSVDSYDYSDYEAATHIVDMGKPFVPEKQYDTILDCGTCEHIFDVAQALNNVSSLCVPGGQIVQVLPANNFCGHGFWQFSPELFFSLYSEKSGYHETEVFLADLNDSTNWFAVEPPKNGRRAEVISDGPLYVMCRTTKRVDAFPQEVQQSDYAHAWDHSASIRPHETGLVRGLKTRIKARPSLHRAALLALLLGRRLLGPLTNPVSLSSRNRHLRKFKVSQLIVR